MTEYGNHGICRRICVVVLPLLCDLEASPWTFLRLSLHVHII